MIKVAVNRYGAIGNCVADALALQDDMEITGALNQMQKNPFQKQINRLEYVKIFLS